MYPEVRKILTVEEQQKVIDAAIADNDYMTLPTHVVEKKGEIVGGWNMASVPLVLAWHKSDSVTVRDSFILKNQIDAIMSDRGTPKYFLACNDKSNYYEHLEKFGYTPHWKTNLFIKE